MPLQEKPESRGNQCLAQTTETRIVRVSKAPRTPRAEGPLGCAFYMIMLALIDAPLNKYIQSCLQFIRKLTFFEPLPFPKS